MSMLPSRKETTFSDVMDYVPLTFKKEVRHWSGYLQGVLDTCYGQPQRKYHNYEHLRVMLQELATVECDFKIKHMNELVMAILFHDAIYVLGSKRNEANSARLARRVGQENWPDLNWDLVSTYIICTEHLYDLREFSVEEQLIADLDLLTFSWDYPHYRAVGERIVDECLLLSAEQDVGLRSILAGRKKFLENFKKGQSFFNLKHYMFNSELARANIKKELEEWVR
jgi:predicted metal-dependent HD superfamily phosphohydrolase